jgi:hypothetical protein
MLAYALLRLPRALVRGRRFIGYRARELPTVPPDWRVGLRLVHGIWVPSPPTATAIRTIAPGCMRVVPPLLCALALTRASLDRICIRLAGGAVIVLTSFNLVALFERKASAGGYRRGPHCVR